MGSVLGHLLLQHHDIFGDLNESLSDPISALGTIHESTPVVCPFVDTIIRLRVHTLFWSRCTYIYVSLHTFAFYYLAHRSAGRRQGKPHKNGRCALIRN